MNTARALSFGKASRLFTRNSTYQLLFRSVVAEHLFYRNIVFEYHWREMPQVSFFFATNTCLSRQNTSFVAAKHLFCRDKTRLLSRQKYAATKVLSRQNYVCRDKNILFPRQKTCFVAVNTCFSRQNICRDINDTWGSSCE